jgi:sugar phosphate isomerase/epimerase
MHLADTETIVSSFLMGNNFGSEDFDAEVEWTIRAIKAADALGVPVVRIDAMMHGEQDEPLEKNVEVFYTAISRVLDATPDSSVEMGIENHSFQGNNPDFLDLLLGRVNSPRLGMTLDTGNFYWRGWPLSKVYEIIEHFAPYCKHTHAKNINYPEDIRETQREMGFEYEKYVSSIADGDIDHKRIVQILTAAGYDRDLCLEDESLWKVDEETRKSVILADADYFRDILG